jgi:hypothetical protein
VGDAQGLDIGCLRLPEADERLELAGGPRLRLLPRVVEGVDTDAPLPEPSSGAAHPRLQAEPLLHSELLLSLRRAAVVSPVVPRSGSAAGEGAERICRVACYLVVL